MVSPGLPRGYRKIVETLKPRRCVTSPRRGQPWGADVSDGTTKQCRKCNAVKPICEFHLRKTKSLDGHASWCKPCATAATKASRHKKPELYNQAQREWRKRRPEAVTAIRRRANLGKYGFTEDSYAQKLAEQDGVCAVCGSSDPRHPSGIFSIDHDHSCCTSHRKCGSCNRGLLCGRCNTILGMANDSIDLLKAAIDYLGRY